MANMEQLQQQWQIALKAPNGYVLYAQELVDGGYDSENPFDLYIATSEGEYVLQDVIDGSDYVHDDGRTIDWGGMLVYACEYELNPGESPVHAFCDNYEACEECDPDEISEFLMDAGIM